jgi:hypothetical protein
VSLDQASLVGQADIALERARDLTAISRHDDLSDRPSDVLLEVRTLCAAAIERLAPPGSAYRSAAHEAINRHEGRIPGTAVRELVGILTALRANYLAGHLRSIQELVHADVFADFLEMAEHLLSNGYKDPSAVISGAVLEEHLRKLAGLYGLSVLNEKGHPKKADLINAQLAKANAYSNLDQKSVTSWLGLRNDAAHGHYDRYEATQVRLMVQAVRDFIARHPA